MSNGIGKSYEEFMGGDFEGFSTCDEFYVKSTEEMLEVALEIGEEAVEALLNTQEIIDKCNVEIPYITMTGVEEKKGKLVGKWKTKEYLFPKFPIPAPFADAKNYFIHLSREGLKKRKEANQLDLINHAEHEYDERLEYEMEVINGMGFPEYFLVLEDVIKFCMEKHIPVGKGRGSGAGSLVAYSLRITDVDPLQFDLLFERFLNPSRISMPDIDIDFCMDRVTEVYEYVIEKYGADHVCKIGTFGTLSAKASIKDLARVFKYDFQKINSFTRQITEIGITIDKILETYEDIKREYETDELFKKIVDYAKRLEGMVRHTSKHASGLIISPFPITDLIPIRGKGIDTSSQYDMHYLELLGLVKLDILKLRTLTVIKRAVDSIRENEGIDIDIDSIDFEDDRVFEQFRQGNTKCIFQFESQGMQSLLKQQQPKSIEDLSAVNSLNIILGEI
jgi:DNA polymerase-3 subunit alpha